MGTDTERIPLGIGTGQGWATKLVTFFILLRMHRLRVADAIRDSCHPKPQPNVKASAIGSIPPRPTATKSSYVQIGNVRQPAAQHCLEIRTAHRPRGDGTYPASARVARAGPLEPLACAVL